MITELIFSFLLLDLISSTAGKYFISLRPSYV